MKTSQTIYSTRNLSIDLIKIIAMSMVVCLHTTYYYIDGNNLTLSFILYNMGDIAIPLFFMVSGYLLLGRKNITYKYVVNKILKIMRFVLILVLTYFVLYSIVKGFSLKTFIYWYCGAFLQSGPFSVFWYFGAMIIIYTILPWLNKLYLKKSQFFMLLAVVAVIQSLAFVSNLTGQGEGKIIQSLRMWNWLTYFMLGGVFHDIHVKNRSWLIAIIVCASVLNIFTIWKLHPFMDTNYCEYFYSSAVVILLVCSIFIFLKSIRITNNLVIRKLSACFLPVYALHTFVINIIKPFTLGTYLDGAFYWILVLLITVTVSLILIRIPIVNNLFKI